MSDTHSKVHVTICSGTACYLLGGGALHDFEAQLPDDIKPYVEVTFSGCLDYCTQMYDAHHHAPYAQINGEMVSSVTLDKLLALVTEAVAHVRK